MPIILPGLEAAGVDLVHFGIMIILNMMVSMITPPMGLMVFIVGGLANIPVGAIFRECVPFITVLFGVLFLITAVPETVTFLPELMR